MMATSQEFPALSSYSDIVPNDDGSVDLYFGPEAPDGKDANWVETDTAKGWSAIFRIYGPLKPFFEQSWKLNDLALVDQRPRLETIRSRRSASCEILADGVTSYRRRLRGKLESSVPGHRPGGPSDGPVRGLGEALPASVVLTR